MTRAVQIAVLSLLVSAAPALAQDDDEEGEDEGWEEEGDADEESEGEDAHAPTAPRKWFFGPFFRYAFVPAFIPQLFLDEAPTVANPGFGATATLRGETISFEIGLGYTSYAFEDPFRAAGDPEVDTEWVDSNLGLVHLTGSMIWDTEFSEKLAFEYGFGLDFGIMTGKMVRTEAFPVSGGFAPCVSVSNPNPIYCEPGPVAYDQEGAHYGVVEERIPPVAPVPMIPHLALRWTPAPEVALKAELAYGIIQFWLGLSAAYAPEL